MRKATKIRVFSLKRPEMKAFHASWLAFFLCFLGWFGVAPLMPVIREELDLTKHQVGNTIIASVAITIFARLLIGWTLDKHGPRRVYTALLALGAVPVFGLGLVHDYVTFLLCRLAIGVVGASFVITQYHTSLMFAPNCVGTANATTAGWGNLGGGVTQMVMPLFLAAFLAAGLDRAHGWRLAMAIPGLLMLGMAWVYWTKTRDTLDGDLKETRDKRLPKGSFLSAAKDKRVWALFVIYGACFGVELTLNNIAAMYFVDDFQLDLGTAGVVAGLFGLMNLFARALGGVFGDRVGLSFGLKGRVALLGALIAAEGLSLIVFSRMHSLGAAIATLVVFSLFVQMSEGATFSVVPFVNPTSLGSVSGIVGAGGNAGAVAAGFLFRSESISTAGALGILGGVVLATSLLSLLVRFSESDESIAREEVLRRLSGTEATIPAAE